MAKFSGKFVLRVPVDLHAKLTQKSHDENISLNQTCLKILNSNLSNAPTTNFDFISNKLKSMFSNKVLIGIVLFGSTVRGENIKSSDLDLLIVLQQDFKITPQIYRDFDKNFNEFQNLNLSPHFVNLFHDSKQCSSLWYEVAVEGKIIFDTSFMIDLALVKLRSEMASGNIQRKFVHGQPYWIKGN